MLHLCALQYFLQYTIKATLHCMPLITAIQKANDCQTNLLQQTLQHNCTSARGFTYSVCHDRQTTHTHTEWDGVGGAAGSRVPQPTWKSIAVGWETWLGVGKHVFDNLHTYMFYRVLFLACTHWGEQRKLLNCRPLHTCASNELGAVRYTRL